MPGRVQSYPQIDTSTFMTSVTALQKISADTDIILKKFADRNFAFSLMEAAQAGNQQKVDQMMNSIGIHSKISAKFSPSGLTLAIVPPAPNPPCCLLTMHFKWER